MSEDVLPLNELKEKYAPSGPERVGFIIGTDVVEVENISYAPEELFEVSLEALSEHLDNASAIWHTQPNRTSQLSYEDYVGFFNFPEKLHIVIGMDGLRVYKVENGQVVKESIHLWET